MVVLQVIAQRGGGDQALAFIQDRAINDPEPTIRMAVLRAIAQDWAAARF
jgi:hypothetical protein